MDFLSLNKPDMEIGQANLDIANKYGILRAEHVIREILR